MGGWERVLHGVGLILVSFWCRYTLLLLGCVLNGTVVLLRKAAEEVYDGPIM
jgi:hypothetical protein